SRRRCSLPARTSNPIATLSAPRAAHLLAGPICRTSILSSHGRRRLPSAPPQPQHEHAFSSILKPATSPKQTSASIHDQNQKTEQSYSFQLMAHPAHTISKPPSLTRLGTCSAWTIPRFCRQRCRPGRLTTEPSDYRL